MAEDSSLAPIALLIDSLRSQDAAQRLASVKRLKTISIALGGSPPPRRAGQAAGPVAQQPPLPCSQARSARGGSSSPL